MSKPTADTKWAASATKTEPSSGQKDAGWSVGQKPPAQWLNWWMDAVDQWKVWLAAFESTAHTWTAKQTFAPGSGVNPVLIQSTGNTDALDVIGSGNGASIFASHSATTGAPTIAAQVLTTEPAIAGMSAGGGGPGVQGRGDNSFTALTSTDDGVVGKGANEAGSAGVRGISAGTSAQAAVTGQTTHNGVPGVLGTSSANAPGVNGKGGVGTGSGVKGETGSTSSTAGVEGVSSHAGVPAVSGTSTDTGDGVYGFNNGSTGAGVHGKAQNSSSPGGVYGESATSGCPGVAGTPGGTGGTDAGVLGDASTTHGYGIIAKGDASNPPNRAAFRIIPQAADPTNAQAGDLTVVGGVLKIYTGSAWVAVGSQ